MKYNILNAFYSKKLYAYLLLLLCCLFSHPLLAQKVQEDVVYLKNGSIIHGTIIENIIGVSIKIQTVDRSIWVFKMEEIEKITREDKPDQPDNKVRNLSKAKGYYNVTTGGLIFVDYDLAGTLTTSNGYKWSPYISTGGMISLDTYGDDLYAPLGVDIRGEILRAPVTPYWFTQIGYPIISPADDTWAKYKPGMMYQAGGGLLFMFSNSLGMVTEVGYKVQHVTHEFEGWGGGSTKQEIQMRNLVFKV
ncbi:MAG: hypothetical protein ACXWW0_14025, partial [Bacteroidia bacterium]